VLVAGCKPAVPAAEAVVIDAKAGRFKARFPADPVTVTGQVGERPEKTGRETPAGRGRRDTE